MARKTAKTTKRTNADTIIQTAFDLAVAKGWRRVGLADIAAEAGLSLAELHAEFSSKGAIVHGFLDRIDREVLAVATDAGDEPRDRLFDIIMRRFDALGPHKEAVSAILRDSYTDPLGSITSLLRLECSMAWMLEAAGLSSSGLCGLARTKGLTLIYGQAFLVWLSDDSADLARTMAALDRGLRRAQKVAGFCDIGRRSGHPTEAEAHG